MAMKDWKEEKFDDMIIYSKTNGDNIRIKKIARLGKDYGKWYVFGYGMKLKDKYSKTKSQALAYARSYMKSH